MGQDPHSPWVREAHGPTSHHGHGPPVTWHPWLMTVCCLVVQGWPHGVPGGFWRCQPHCPTGSQRTSPAPTLGGAARDRQETGRWHAVPQPEPTGSTCRRVGAADAHTHAERMNTGHAHGTGDTTPPRGRASEDCGATSASVREGGKLGHRGPQLGLEAGCMCSFRALPTCSVPGRHRTACPRSPVLAPLTLAPSLGHAPAPVPATSFLISAAHPVGGTERGREEREQSPRRESRRTTARWTLRHQDAGRLNPEAKQRGAGRSPQGARPWARCHLLAARPRV